MIRSLITGIVFLAFAHSVSAQNQNSDGKKYKESQVYNTDYGINVYEKMNFLLGGDSVRFDPPKNFKANGWREDFYDNGQMLHRGYYQDGQLKIYKNFFDNGQLERNFVVKPNPSLYSMKIYYKDGKPRSEIDYIKGNPQKWQDWYPNGNLEFIEEYDRNLEYYIQQKTYYEDGKPQSLLELVDERKKIYSKKEYYPNGNIKEEGTIHFDKFIEDYRKEGVWLVYDESGKLVEENTYVKGELSNSVKK
jgi:antitoxin component YwqK of YwqJK toxin-antitoxin module